MRRLFRRLTGAALGAVGLAVLALPGAAGAVEIEYWQYTFRQRVEAIDALPARCREIFIRRKLQGVSQKDIAARLGLSEQTVQGQAARGLRRVSERYNAERMAREYEALYLRHLTPRSGSRAARSR